MSTGVTVTDATFAEFNEFRKASNTSKFLILKIENGVIIKETISEDSRFEEFLSALPADECRYAVYKMDYTTHDGRPGNKLVSISWLVFYWNL
jgi:cofilin